MRSVIPLLIISGCALAAWPRDEYKRDFSKTAAITAGRMVRIEHSNGRLSIHTHTRNEVAVQASIRCSASNANEARSCADRIQIDVQANGGDAIVRTTYPSNLRDTSFAVDLDVTMPQTSPLEARNRFGSTDVSGLHAPATINSGNGNVTFLAGRGNHRIENSFGNVEARNNEGDVTIVNGSGGVTAVDIKGAAGITNRFGNTRAANIGRGLTIRSSSGMVEAENISGTANLGNSFGRIMVTDAKGDVIVQNQSGEVVANGIAGNAELHTTFGPITFSRIGKSVTAQGQSAPVRGDTVEGSATVETTFGFVELRGVRGAARVSATSTSIKLSAIGGEIYAKTTFNGITIYDAVGPVTAENESGSVTVETKPGIRCQPMTLRTTFGPIRAGIPRGAGYNLSARTSFGRIHTDSGIPVTLTGAISPESVNGKIAGGGCELRLSGQNSNIDIQGR